MENASGRVQTYPPGWIDRGSVQFALVAAVAVTTLFVRLGVETMDEHESKAALAARGMLRDRPDEWVVAGPGGAPMAEEDIPPRTPLNRWLVPVNNGLPRLVKTPLPYWLMAAAGKLTGGVSEWSARAPSAVSAVLCALVVLALGRRMFGPRPALWGALVFLTSVGVQKWGRNARPEMVLCLCITAAMGCFYMGLSATRRRDRAAWMLAFWAAMGLANLAKEFVPLLMAVPLLIFLCYERARAMGREDVFEDHALCRWWLRRRRPGGLGRWRVGRGVRRGLDAVIRRPLALCLVYLLAGVLVGIAFQAVRQGLGFGSVELGLAVTGLLLLAPIAWYGLLTRVWRGIWPLLPTAIPGVILMLAAFLPWMWYMQKLFGGAGDIFAEQVTERAAGEGGWGVEGPWYYVLPLLTLILPWLGLLPGALAAPWLKAFADRRRELMYLLLWSAGLIAVLTASAGKREHYILPALGAVSLLMGFVADDVFRRRRWAPAVLGRIVGVSYGAASVAGVATMAGLWVVARHYGSDISALVDQGADISRTLLHLRFPIRWLHMLVVTAVAALPALLAARASLLRPPATFPLLLAAGIALYVGIHVGGRYWDDRAPVAEFARLAKARVGAETQIASWGDPQAKVVYYFGRNIHSVTWERARLVRQYGPEEGTDLWQRWLANPQEIQWMFSYGSQTDKTGEYGFRVDTRVQGQQKQQTVFVLSGREGR